MPKVTSGGASNQHEPIVVDVVVDEAVPAPVEVVVEVEPEPAPLVVDEEPASVTVTAAGDPEE